MIRDVYFYRDEVHSIISINSAARSLALEKQLFIMSASHIAPPLLCTYRIFPSVSNITLTVSLERFSSLSVGSDSVTLGLAKMQKVDEIGNRRSFSGLIIIDEFA